MQGLMRVVCIAYWIFLTALLLTSDPMRLIGVREDVPALLRWLMPASHFLSFFVLSVLALMVRWPVPRWGIALLLVLYSGLTEAAQNFNPARRTEWGDWLQDMAGVAVGVAFCWIVASVGNILVGRKRATERREVPVMSNEWDVVRAVMSHQAAPRSQSWWG